MTLAVGIGLAFIAMLSWGVGDFLIQKSTRKLGDWETLFIISFFGGIVLLPFVWKSLPGVIEAGGEALVVLVITSVVLFLAALVDFEALKEGKLAIVEPIWSMEVPVSAVLAFLIIGERISGLQIALIALLIGCLMMVGFREKHLKSSFLMEKGVVIAFLGAVLMGSSNFFMGWGGRLSDPLVVNFFTDASIMILCAIYLLLTGRMGRVWPDLKNTYNVMLPMSIADKVAWVAYVFSMTLAPIAVATALSESYIIIAVLLGLVVNKEHLQRHQKLGLVGAVAFAVILAMITT